MIDCRADHAVVSVGERCMHWEDIQSKWWHEAE